MIETIPLGCLGSPEDLGKATVFLASNDSAYITGVELDVDGRGAVLMPRRGNRCRCGDAESRVR